MSQRTTASGEKRFKALSKICNVNQSKLKINRRNLIANRQPQYKISASMRPGIFGRALYAKATAQSQNRPALSEVGNARLNSDIFKLSTLVNPTTRINVMELDQTTNIDLSLTHPSFNNIITSTPFVPETVPNKIFNIVPKGSSIFNREMSANDGKNKSSGDQCNRSLDNINCDFSEMYFKLTDITKNSSHRVMDNFFPYDHSKTIDTVNLNIQNYFKSMSQSDKLNTQQQTLGMCRKRRLSFLSHETSSNESLIVLSPFSAIVNDKRDKTDDTFVFENILNTWKRSTDIAGNDQNKNRLKRMCFDDIPIKTYNTRNIQSKNDTFQFENILNIWTHPDDTANNDRKKQQLKRKHFNDQSLENWDKKKVQPKSNLTEKYIKNETFCEAFNGSPLSFTMDFLSSNNKFDNLSTFYPEDDLIMSISEGKSQLPFDSPNISSQFSRREQMQISAETPPSLRRILSQQPSYEFLSHEVPSDRDNMRKLRDAHTFGFPFQEEINLSKSPNGFSFGFPLSPQENRRRKLRHSRNGLPYLTGKNENKSNQSKSDEFAFGAPLYKSKTCVWNSGFKNISSQNNNQRWEKFSINLPDSIEKKNEPKTSLPTPSVYHKFSNQSSVRSPPSRTANDYNVNETPFLYYQPNILQ